MWGGGTVAPTPAPEDRGDLLMEEPPEAVARRAGAVRKAALLLAGVGVALLAVWLVFPRDAPWGFLSTLILLTGVLLLALGLLLLWASRRVPPFRFYENGLEIRAYAGGAVRFVSYGEVLAIEEAQAPLVGAVYRLRVGTPGAALGPGMFVDLPRDLPGIAPVLDRVRARMGRAEFVVKPPAAPPTATARRLATFTPALALVLAAVAAFVAILLYPPGIALPDPVLDFALAFSLIGMILVTYAALRVRRAQPAGAPAPSLPASAAIVALLLVLGLASLALAPFTFGAQAPTPDIGPRPAATALAPGVYENATLNVTGVVRVDAGETLTIRNANLTIAPSGGTPGGVWVGAGGRLALDNVTVRGAGSRITFEIMGSAAILRSDVADLAGDPAKDHTDGGLEIYSSDVLLDGTTVHDTATNGIFVVGANPVIRNSTVLRPGDDGIELQRSSALVEDDTFQGCGWAMIVWVDSSPTIRRSRFVDNAHGIWMDASGGRIEQNTFTRNGEYAVQLVGGSDPVMSGNAFLTAADVVDRSRNVALDLGLVCGPMFGGVGVVCLAALLWRHRKDRAASLAASPINPR